MPAISGSYLRESAHFAILPFVAVTDIIPELLTVGTLASSAFGVYFERIRKRIERAEPEQIESVATEAAAQVDVEAAPPAASGRAWDDEITISSQDLKKLLGAAVNDGAVAAITAMKGELTVERKQDRRAALRANVAFFIAGIMATVAITLYVHPLT